MMNRDEYRQFLLSKLPVAKSASGGDEVVTRCRYCSDSKDRTHGHMYISIPNNNGDVSTFYCQKCHTSGIVDSRRLLEWGIFDTDVSSYLSSVTGKSNKKVYNIDHIRYNTRNIIYDNELAIKKLNYLNSRLGTNLTLQQALNDNIVFNLKDILRFNNIQNLTRHQNIIDQINKVFMGFLSFDRNFINFRKLCKDGIVHSSIDKRYINYNIYGKKDNTEKFYIIPSNIDISSYNRIKVHIAEGPFDILSIKWNLNNGDNNAIYCAITGSGYKGVLMNLLTIQKIFWIELHMYPDNDDVGNKMVRDAINFIRPYNIPTYIHKNNISKDFGVSILDIKESIIKIF